MRALRVLLISIVCTLASCRACDSAGGRDDAGPSVTARASEQRPLPVGMLAPLPVAADASRSFSERLRVSVGQTALTGGEWYELQPAEPDASVEVPPARWSARSRFVTPEAMPLVSEAIARGAADFNPFTPTFVPARNLPRVRAALEALQREWSSTANLEAGKATWGTRASFVATVTSEAEWVEARSAFASALEAVSAFVAAQEAAGVGVWLLPS